MPPVAQFPLQSVLLPGMPLGLQVFEPRYLQLLDDVTADDNRFGVVMITRGSEVGGADERAEVGTMAEVVVRRPAPGGRWLVEAVGIERFQVIRWLDDDPYPRAEIEPWTLMFDAPAQVSLEAARERFAGFLSLVTEMGADVGEVVLPDGEVDALYRMAAIAPISTHDRYRVLAAENGSEAADTLVDALDGVVDVLRFRLQNG